MWYFIQNPKSESYFLNLCGHYSITGNINNASRWDDSEHKAMWYFVHELRATTNQGWEVVDENGTTINETDEARRFEIRMINTIENVEKDVVVERLTYNEEFAGDKPKPDAVYYAELRINGVQRFLPVARIGNKYYRYKMTLSAMDMSEKMWRW